MFSPGMRVAVAVSGGADSMALLYLLQRAAPRWNLQLSVVHLDHKIRPQSAEDAAFVEEIAGRLGLKFHLRRVSIPALGGNAEQTAREARHAFFRELLQTEVERVTTGHTREDQAETVLYRIVRGAGLTGLRGILPLTKDGVARPLLYSGREELRDWLQLEGISWREDETNRNLGFARNRLRHEVFPLLAKHLNCKVQHNLARLATIAQEEEDFWSGYLGSCEESSPGEFQVLSVPELRAEHRAVARRRVRRALETVHGKLRRIGFENVEAVLDLAHAPSGHGRIQVPGLEIVRSFDQIRISVSEKPHQNGFRMPIRISAAGAEAHEISAVLPQGHGRVEFRLASSLCARTCQAQDTRHDTVGDELDWERLARLSGTVVGLELRNWRAGDRYRPVGKRAELKLKHLFQNARVPVWERRNWPVVTCGGKIVWTRGFGSAAELEPQFAGFVLSIRYFGPRASREEEL